jgi:outer membrane protein TolC
MRGNCGLNRAKRTSAGLIAVLCVALSGCAITPKPLDAVERERIAEEARRQLFDNQEALATPLTLAEATARAIKYQAEQRQRRMEQAAAEAQLDVSKFDLLPKLTLNAGYSTRSNDAFGFGFTPAGTIATTPSASVERTRNTASIGLAWNVLDFGVSYFRAKQLADQTLIAEERRRKAVQILMHDVRVAWWRAEAAERLLPAADRLLREVDRAIERTRQIEARKLLPPVQTATLRRALLDLAQQIAFRRQDLAQSRIELASLVNLPPGTELRIALPPSEKREVLDLTADLQQLETLALQSRPEMAEEGYRARISADEARKALVGLLPNLSFDLARNYDSNRFLLNNSWTSAGVNVAFNLVKAFSLPALNRSKEAQQRADDARRQAMAMAVLTQTRVAAVRYMLVADEFLVWDEAARDDDLIVQYLASSEKAGIDNELESIRTRARAMASHINRDLAFANVQASMARLFNSIGYDAVPFEDEALAVAELAARVEKRYADLESASFSAHAADKQPALAAGLISGASARVARLLREGAERVLDSSSMKAPDAKRADARLDMQLALGPTRNGRRSVEVTVRAVPGPGAPVTLTRQFKTTLSEPIDDEQWRVLGEGAVYRLIGDLSPARITRPALRPSHSLRPKSADGKQAALAMVAGDRSQPLELRLDRLLGASEHQLVGASIGK